MYDVNPKEIANDIRNLVTLNNPIQVTQAVKFTPEFKSVSHLQSSCFLDYVIREHAGSFRQKECFNVKYLQRVVNRLGIGAILGKCLKISLVKLVLLCAK